MLNRYLVVAVAALLLVSCSSSDATGSAHGQPTSKVQESPVQSSDCTSAPPSLLAALERSLTPVGATLSRAYILRAVGLDATLGFDGAWVIGAMISGAGARPEVGIWVSDGTEPRAGAVPLALNASAKRYSDLPASDASLPVDIASEIEACVGPVPEP